MYKTVAPVITLDGPSGTGKGTLCHLLAQHLGWHLLDSGAIYRVLALAAMKAGFHEYQIPELVELAQHLELVFQADRVLLQGVAVQEEIRTQLCAQHASRLAALPEIRAALLMRQRAFAEPPGLVTDGRDMGTVVFPQADLKIYLFATSEARAERRYLQLKNSGKSDTLAQVIEELAERDARDMARAHAPLAPAHDAIAIDTTSLSIDDVFNQVLLLAMNRGLGEK